jgi:catechol 2,3-dioxygenase-like lactoylglutathione lyase family enzyme
MMRGLVLFVAGILVGVTAQSGLAQQPGQVVLNHVGISVPNVNEAVAYYTQKMGFREAFRGPVDQATGQPALVYMHISRDTFLEIQPVTPQRPAGISHFGLQVPSMKEAVARYRANGATVSDPNVSANTKALLANVSDPNGNRAELGELTPESLHRKAIESWK